MPHKHENVVRNHAETPKFESYPGLAQLVEPSVWGGEVVSSSPTARTKNTRWSFKEGRVKQGKAIKVNAGTASCASTFINVSLV
jgi:hypothetical protein